MRNRTILLVLVLVTLLGAALAVPVAAQDDMMTHTCDSTLILLLYLAEHDYGYQPMMDVASFEKGQFAPLFDAMMAMEEEGAMTEEDAMMEEEMMATEEMMMEDEGMAEGEMLMLVPGSIEGEDPACTELRASLEAFFLETLTKGL